MHDDTLFSTSEYPIMHLTKAVNVYQIYSACVMSVCELQKEITIAFVTFKLSLVNMERF